MKMTKYDRFPDPYKGKPYLIFGESNYLPPKKLLADNPKSAVRAWFELQDQYPGEAYIVTKTDEAAIDLVNSIDDEYLIELFDKYESPYLLEYLLDTLYIQQQNNCKDFNKDTWSIGGQIPPFSIQ